MSELVVSLSLSHREEKSGNAACRTKMHVTLRMISNMFVGNACIICICTSVCMLHRKYAADAPNVDSLGVFLPGEHDLGGAVPPVRVRDEGEMVISPRDPAFEVVSTQAEAVAPR